jgi:hypothetical protein
MKKRLLFIVKKHKRSKNKQKTNIYRNQMKKKQNIIPSEHRIHPEHTSYGLL